MKKANNQGWFKQAVQALPHTPYLPPIMFLLVVTLFALAQTLDYTTESYEYQIGDIVAGTSKPQRFFIEDKATNLAKMNSAETSIRTVYDLDANLLKNITTGITSAMQFGRKMFQVPDNNVQESSPPESPETTLPESPEISFSTALALKPEFEKKLGIKISKGAFQILFNEKFSEEVTGYLSAIISTIWPTGSKQQRESFC